jgi:hypothetical protein
MFLDDQPIEQASSINSEVISVPAIKDCFMGVAMTGNNQAAYTAEGTCSTDYVNALHS